MEFLLNKRNLILFYFEGIFLQYFVFRIFFSNLYNNLCHIIWGINMIWVLVIAIYDSIHKNYDFKNKKNLILFLYFIISTISWILYQPNHSIYTLYDLFKLFEFSFIFYTYSKYVSKNELENTIKVIAYSFCIYVFIYNLFSLSFFSLGHTQVTYPNGGVADMIGIDNALAHKTRFMGLWSWYTESSFHSYIAICLHLYFLEHKKNKLIHYICIAMCSFMIYLSDTRTSLINLGFILISFIIFKLQQKLGTKKTLSIGAFIFIIAIIGFISMKFISNKELFEMLISNPFDTISYLSSGRIEMAKGIIGTLKTNFFFGSGYGNNTFVVSKYGIGYPHNLFLELILYTGVLGLIVFSAFLILNIIQIFKNYHYIMANNYKWILVLTTCIFIESQFAPAILGCPSSNIETLFFFLCLGIIVNERV